MLAIAAFCGILCMMFWVLSRSPKGSKHILGKQSGFKKRTFVVVCVLLALLFSLALILVLAPDDIAGAETSNTDITADENTEQHNEQAEIVLLEVIYTLARCDLAAVGNERHEYHHSQEDAIRVK